MVGISKGTGHKEIREKRLRVKRVGKKILVPAKSIDLWLESTAGGR